MAGQKKNIIGVVLCGGNSVRMGADKGLLQQNITTWAELAADKLAGLKLEVVVSVNERQAETYTRIFDTIPVVTDNSRIDVFGPLKGILSVHLQYPDADLLVLACDMPAMTTEVLEYLLKSSLDKTEEAVVFINDNRYEPLCAVYTSVGLKKIYETYRQGKLLKYSLQYVLQALRIFQTSIPAKWKGYFNNYNFPEDLDGLLL